ncbi:hypothetical protein ACFC1I_14300 [Microbacterium sp. NPDC056044]|uniref:hypothetical protein n=1 Tax=Microbacterium sp. NPDC056044 TaxID=3345690 RepID=UPI0035D58883
MRLTASAALLVLTAVVLAGCASPAGPQTSTPPTRPDASATAAAAEPSATAGATPTIDPEDPSTWLITDSGIGPIELGMPFSAALELMPPGTTNDPERCAWLAWWTAEDQDYNVYTAGSSDAADAGPVGLVATEAWANAVAGPGPRTADGIGVGSTVDEVRAAYPEAVETVDTIDSSIVHLRAGRIFFTYREDPVIASVTVTAMEMPPYELCG